MVARDMMGVQGPAQLSRPQLTLPTQGDAQLSNKRGLEGKPVSSPAPLSPAPLEFSSAPRLCPYFLPPPQT